MWCLFTFNEIFFLRSQNSNGIAGVDYLFKSVVCVIRLPTPGPHIRPSAPEPHKNFNLLVLHLTTCFKETALLFNVHLSCFVDFILCPTNKYMFKVNNKNIRWICWMSSKLKTNIARHSSSVFIVDSAHSQHINIVLLLLTLNKYVPVGCERQVIMLWKHKKHYICLVIKVARPISFSGLSLHQMEINFEQITILWTYYEHNINICSSSKFVPGILSVLSLFPSVF